MWACAAAAGPLWLARCCGAQMRRIVKPRLAAHTRLNAMSGVQELLAEAKAVLAAASSLSAEQARLCREAEASLAKNPPGINWVPEGCEDAPPDVMAKLGAMTAGAGEFPADADVDRLWAAMASASLAQSEAAAEEPPRWTPGRLRAMGQSMVNLGFRMEGRDEDIKAACRFAADSLARWRAVDAALKRGLCTSVPAAPGTPLEIYATHLTCDDYILGAEVLAASLLATRTTRPLVAMITDGVTPQGRGALTRAGWTLVDVGLAGQEHVDTPQARGFFSKIWLWALPVHKVIYIDTDILVVRSLDSLFSDCKDAVLAAAPDSQPHMDGELITQTGLIVLEPSPDRFADLWLICSGSGRPKPLDKWKQFEQGFLTLYFDGSSELADCGGGCGLGWQELDAQYNFCVRYMKRPLYDGLGPTTTSVVHYACAKPWDPKQKNYAPAPYVRLYLEFARAAGVAWTAVDCTADRARERENIRKMQEIQAARG